MSPAVSVVVACYNAGPFLAPCLDSVLAQSFADLEVIVVDDGSSDDSRAVAEDIAARDGRVRLLPPAPNGGPAAARNRGLAAARGRWYAVMDSDDLWHPERLALLLQEAEAQGAEVISDDLLVFVDGSDAAPTRFLLPRDQGRAFDVTLDTYLSRTIFYGREPNLGFLKPMVRRERLAAHGITYDETLRIAEDDDFIARMLLAGMRYRVLGRPLYFYRKHPASISHRLTKHALEAMIRAADGFARLSAAQRPANGRANRVRIAALHRALAFERAIVALKARRPLAAVISLLRRPAATALFRIPLGDKLRRLRARPAAHPALRPAGAELARLTSIADGA